MIHLKQFFVQRERERVRDHGTWKIVCRAVKDLTFPVQFIKMDAIWGPPPSIHQAARSIFEPLFTQYFNFASIPSWHGVQSSRVKYCRTTYKVWCYGILDCLLSMSSSEPALRASLLTLTVYNVYEVCVCVCEEKLLSKKAIKCWSDLWPIIVFPSRLPCPPQKCPLLAKLLFPLNYL